MSLQRALETRPRTSATERFNRIRSRGMFLRLWSMLTGQNQSLLNLHDVEQQLDIRERRYVGAKTVTIEQIRGSENRCGDFDAAFRPLQNHTRERWVNIAVAMDNGKPMPAVDLVEIGGTYFVRDGHHRISVAREIGQECIDAHVTVCQGNEQRLAQAFSAN